MRYTLLDRYYKKYIKQGEDIFLNNFTNIMNDISFKDLNDFIKTESENKNDKEFVFNYEDEKSIKLQTLTRNDISTILEDVVKNKIKDNINDFKINNILGIKIIDNCYKNTALTILYDIEKDSYMFLEGFFYENGFLFIKKNKIVLEKDHTDFIYIIGILSDIGDNIYKFED